MRETVQLMLEHFTTDDKEEDDTELYKLSRSLALEPVDTDDDIDFTVEETRNAVASMDKKKAPGEDGTTGEVYKSAFEEFPRYITAMYNGCLRRGVFPKRWKTAKLIPTVKPGKEAATMSPNSAPLVFSTQEGKC